MMIVDPGKLRLMRSKRICLVTILLLKYGNMAMQATESQVAHHEIVHSRDLIFLTTLSCLQS